MRRGKGRGGELLEQVVFAAGFCWPPYRLLIQRYKVHG